MLQHRARKRFGQNFLVDQTIIQAIISAIRPHPHDNMLEIGPGLGALTSVLLQTLSQLKAVEIDRDLVAELHLRFGERLLLTEADALTVDYSQFEPRLRVVGNLPYNISTPLLLHLLKYKAHIEDMHFMLQKEVVERLAAQPGTRDYGRLSIMLQYDCEVEYLFTVPPTAFSPAPKVDSAIVRIIPYDTSPYEAVDRKVLAWVVAKAFHMRRKTLSNNLKAFIEPEILQSLGLDIQKRPEHLSIEEYVKIARYYTTRISTGG
jgi:16S rRNA (adenine1518-N6/adenine1519-N6)-dimethyltransferase